MKIVIKWKDEYCVGVEFIDEQHQQLFEIANRTYDLLKNEIITDKYGKIIEIIEELTEYTIYHFQSEEDYMQSIGYKKFFSQKVTHNINCDRIKWHRLNQLGKLLHFKTKVKLEFF